MRIAAAAVARDLGVDGLARSALAALHGYFATIVRLNEPAVVDDPAHAVAVLFHCELGCHDVPDATLAGDDLADLGLQFGDDSFDC